MANYLDIELEIEVAAAKPNAIKSDISAIRARAKSLHEDGEIADHQWRTIRIHADRVMRVLPARLER